MASWKSQCRSRDACRSQQEATWHRDLRVWLSHKGPVWLGVHGQAGWKDCTWRQWSPQSHDLQSEHGDRSSDTWNTMVSCSTWCTDYTCHHSHRLNKPAAKDGVWNWVAPTGTQPYSVFGCKDFYGSTALDMPESVGMNRQLDWQA